MLGAEDFRTIIKTRWEKLRQEPSTPEQAWSIPQPGRNTWGDSRKFNKVSLVSQIIGYRHRINTKSDAKCLDKYLGEASKAKLIITETEGPTVWKYPKLQNLKKFQERRGLNYSVIQEVEVQESLEGVELHPDADEKAQTCEELFSELRCIGSFLTRLGP